MTPLSEFNTVREVADYLRVSPRHLYNLIAGGRLGHVKVGTLVRVRREDVETFLAANRHEVRSA